MHSRLYIPIPTIIIMNCKKKNLKRKLETKKGLPKKCHKRKKNEKIISKI